MISEVEPDNHQVLRYLSLGEIDNERTEGGAPLVNLDSDTAMSTARCNPQVEEAF